MGNKTEYQVDFSMVEPAFEKFYEARAVNLFEGVNKKELTNYPLISKCKKKYDNPWLLYNEFPLALTINPKIAPFLLAKDRVSIDVFKPVSDLGSELITLLKSHPDTVSFYVETRYWSDESTLLLTLSLISDRFTYHSF